MSTTSLSSQAYIILLLSVKYDTKFPGYEVLYEVYEVLYEVYEVLYGVYEVLYGVYEVLHEHSVGWALPVYLPKSCPNSSEQCPPTKVAMAGF
ncbi:MULTISPECIES: hypothetical protein [unclassified Moorena]|uniref:hypothetical protein n=1 Tax=unclassified Moorena TaxID=2683338 RepID=UPI0013BB7348|nr:MULTISPECIES: hypothetical protein [unclassified Moorena]NEP32762.1 hypothetical protein [Moorena sp. SIO3B2]NEQ11657.1 hypothetical protein [Moorena sp. SIO4E2]